MKLTRRALLKSSVVLAGCGTALTNPPGHPVDTAGPSGPNGGDPNAPGSGTPTPGQTDKPKPKPSGPDLVPSEVEQSDASFPLAVMAGDMTATTSVVWTQYVATNPLKLYAWPEGGAAVSADASTDERGFVHFDLSELQPGTRYQYTFIELVNGEPATRSAIGHFKTAPAADSQGVVTFGAACCTHQRQLPFPVMARAATVPLDFFIHAGDHCYCDDAENEQDFQDLYAEMWQSSGMRALHSAHGLYTTWDDHEFENNFNPETIDADRLAWATDTFFRHHAIKRNEDKPKKLWRSFVFGQSVELFVLDCRSERKPSTRNGANPQYISPEQMTWLKNGLANSLAKFKFIVNSVPIGHFGGLFAFGADDRWEGYGAQRTELLDHITDQHIAGVMFISGDFHLGSSGTVESTGKYSTLREVLVGPGGNHENPIWQTLQSADNLEYLTPKPNFVVFSADPVKEEVAVSFVDKDGTVLFTKTYSGF